MQFQQVQMPDGTPKGRKMWRASSGDNYAAFYPVGRKGRFYVTWGAASGRCGGEQVDSQEAAQNRATEIMSNLVNGVLSPA